MNEEYHNNDNEQNVDSVNEQYNENAEVGAASDAEEVQYNAAPVNEPMQASFSNRTEQTGGSTPYYNATPGGGNPGYGGYRRPTAGNGTGSYYQTPGTGYDAYGNTGQQGTNPSYGGTPTEAAKAKSSGNRHFGVKVAALALACVIAGGAIGGGIAAAVLSYNKDQQSTSTLQSATAESVKEIGGDADPEKTTDTEGEAQGETAFERTTIEVKSNSGTNSLTPKDVYENYVNAVVAISNEGTSTNYFGQVSKTASSGSGMIISEDGYILTNNHVVSGAETLTVIMTSGEEYPATVIGADSENDVALIKIEATGLPTVAIGDSGEIAVGQQVCAIGNPLGELTNTLTVGYVSALDREIYESATGTSVNMFQTDCAINSGNSGGPIFDMSGNVIGITTAKYSSSGMSSSASIEGIGFCVPINDAMDIVSDFLTYGYVRGRATLGVTCRTISSTVTQYYNLPQGVYIEAVTENSGAADAGIQQGDIICKVNDTEVTSVSDLKAVLKKYSPGDVVTLEIYRNGQTITASATLGESIVNANASSTTENAQQSEQSTDGTQIPSGTFPFGFNFGY